MKKFNYILLAFCCVIGMVSCQDDLIEKVSAGGADVNKPVKVNLKFNVPDADEVNLSRSYDNSDLGDLHLFIFDGNTFLSDESVTSDNIRRTSNTNGNEYTISATLYEGEQTVYAVGNVTTQTNYWESPVSALREAAANGREDFLNTLYNVRQDVVSGGFVTFPGNYRPLAGSGDVTVQADGSAKGTIYMKREVARIKLNVNMNYTVTESGKRNGNKVTFTPQTYSVYNVASKGYVMETEDGNTQRTAIADGFYAVENMTNFNVSDGEVATIGDGFNIPENLQQPQEPGRTYAQRDKWFEKGDEPGAADDAKEWTYAPQYGTYIVIKGNYVETDASGNVVYSAAPSYTFHLGEWDSENDFGNFNVERNTIYTYTVTIHGVENMIVEVDKEQGNPEYQPGAEGDVIELGEGSEVFNLDAHYEQVYVEYNLSEIANTIKESGIPSDEIDNAIATNFMLSIHSPMNTKSGAEELVTPYMGTEADAMNGIDSEWIRFYSQNRRNTLSTYTSTRGNDDYLLSPWDACQKMGEAVKDLIDNENTAPSVTGLRTVRVSNYRNVTYYACFTVFVDEYFYTEDLSGSKVSWEKFARAEPRTLLIASDWNASPDGNTTYAKARTYISQASILTFYNTEAAQNTKALGIESYNEYGVISGFGNSRSFSTQFAYNQKRINVSDYETNGRANMLWDIDDLTWNNVPFTRIGYLSDNTGTDGHKWSKLTPDDKTNSAYYACLSRNRDLNRDGVIDDNEVRWYLPARSQYLRMGIGANSFNTDVQLYNGNKNDLGDNVDGYGYPQNQLNYGTLYYSNTPYNKGSNYGAWELYWAVEVGAYGSNFDGNPQYGNQAQIRCVRNLPSNEDVENDSYGDGALADPVYGELKRLNSGNHNYIFDFGNRMTSGINRTSPYNGPYREHNEMEEQNRLYKAFVVADHYIKAESGEDDTFTADEAASYYKNPCRSYSENGAPAGTWRTPNLNELTVMSTVATELGLQANTMSSTTFFNNSVRGLFYYNGSMISAWDPGSGSGPIRCVRDATDEEIANAQPAN